MPLEVIQPALALTLTLRCQCVPQKVWEYNDNGVSSKIHSVSSTWSYGKLPDEL